MADNHFSNDDISRSIELLIKKFSKISIFAHILDEYFENGKFIITRKTMPLSMVLSELTFHISGQLSRLCFDKSPRNYKTASICEIYNKIENNSGKGAAKGVKHLARFEAAKNSIKLIEDNYKNKFKLLADKHYAHLEVRTEEEVKADYQIFQTSWVNIKKLIEEAKNILFVINLFWEDTDTDFCDTQYEDFKRRFWNLISLPDRNSSEFWT